MQPQELKILLIEEDRHHAALVEKALIPSRLNCSVDKAFSGAQGLEMLSTKAYDLLILDYGLADSDGLTVMKAVRAKGFDKPIIITTQEGNEKIAAELDDYIIKDDQYPGIVPCVISLVLEKDRLRKKSEELERGAFQSEKLQAVVKTVRTLNHEINNPLMTVLGNAQLLQGPKYRLSQRAVDKIRLIEENALRIKEVTRELSDLLRLQCSQDQSLGLPGTGNPACWSDSSQAKKPMSSP